MIRFEQIHINPTHGLISWHEPRLRLRVVLDSQKLSGLKVYSMEHMAASKHVSAHHQHQNDDDDDDVDGCSQL